MHAVFEQEMAQLLPGNVLAEARALFPHTKTGKIYLNHAGTSPLSTRVVAAIKAHLQERSEGSIDTYLSLDVPKIAECRELVKALINAESTERVALLTNTSDPLNVVASGLKWKSGDRVLLHEDEFPANVWPYLNLKRFGVEIDVIPKRKGHPTSQLIADSISDRTRLVALSAVQFLTGYRADLAAIGSLCREKGIVLVVDGIQAVGAVRLDVQNMKIDALAAGCQKWQMGPHGSGWLYLTEELQSAIQPTYVGWLAVEEPWNFFDFRQPLASSARRFEGGTKNIPSLWGMGAALSTLLEFGLEEIEGHILALSQLLLDGLRSIDGVRVITPADLGSRAGIVTIELAQEINAESVFRQLERRDITIALRDGKLRYAPHFYNSAPEIELAISATQESVQQLD